MEKSRLKILMITPLSVGLVRGGVRMQSLKTAEYLQKTGNDITFFNPWKSYNPEDFDIVHLFLAANETLTTAQRLKDFSCKLVVSPVFFTRRSASIIRNLSAIEYIGGQFIKGIFSDYSIKSSVCKAADLLLPNTSEEARLISKGFGIEDKKIKVVPNGVDLRFENATPELFHKKFGIQNFTLFVGDGSAPRKNLLPLLSNYTAGDPPLVVIGSLDESDYARKCRNIMEGMDNITYTGPIDHDDPMLESAYAAAAVFTLPSQYETPGIAALEAALAGCQISITKIGGTEEYFGSHAEYIDPENEASIMQAIRKAHDKEPTVDLKNHIKRHFSWEVVALKTEEAYNSLL